MKLFVHSLCLHIIEVSSLNPNIEALLKEEAGVSRMFQESPKTSVIT